jgi:hypothetical protein
MALIRDATGDRQLADDWHLDLSIEIVSGLPSDGFELRASDIVTWLEASPSSALLQEGDQPAHRLGCGSQRLDLRVG